MKNTRRILSLFMSLLMVLSVFNVGVTAFAATTSGSILKEIVLEPVARPQVEFYCTEVTRVAAGANSVQPGNQIVKATPSGVPELSGSFASQAYAGETPAATRITFVSPTAGIAIVGFSCNNATVTFSDTSFTAPGTYTIDVTGGTAEAGTALTFTVDYTWTDGNTYQEKCVSYVESIATGGSFAEHRVTWKPYNGTSSWYRGYASAITRVLGKGVYYEAPADGGMSQQFGAYDVSTASFVSGSGYTSYYSNERVESAGLFSNPRETIDHTLFVTGTPQAHIYVDASQASSLSDINLRIDANVGAENGDTHVRNNDTPNVALGESYVVAGAQTSAPSGYSTDTTAQNTIGFSIPARSNYGFDSENGAYSTITSGSRNGGHIITSHLTGSVAGIVNGASYTVINRYYAYFRGSYAYITNSPIVPTVMTFHIVDKGALREMVDYVMNSDPSIPTTRATEKGVNPQAWYYQSGFSQFQTSYVDAIRVLNNPQATQAEIDASTKSLRTMYNNLKLKAANYTRVNELYDIADEIIENEAAYPPSDIALIREAQEMVTKSYSILYQSAVDTMAYNLQLAIERAMPYGANYEEIYALKLEYQDIDLTNYTPESIQVVEDAFAKVDYTLTMLEQDTVDAWADEIRLAIDSLAPYTADFSELEATLEEAKAIDRTLYINGSLLLQPMEDAENAINDNATNPWELSRQDEVDALTQALREKIDGLILRSVYKLDLKAAIDAEIPGEIEFYDQTILAEYEALVAEGTEMYNDDTLTIYDQKEIDAMTESIIAKYEELMASYTIPGADKTALKEAIDAEIPGERAYYDQALLAEYDALVAEGTEMYEDATLEIGDQGIVDAKTEEITSKYNELLATYNPPVDKAELEEIIVEAESITEDGQYKDDEAMDELLDAIAEGKNILDSDLNDSEENRQIVADSVARIRDAIVNLNYKDADLTEINNLVNVLADLSAETVSVTTYIDGELGTEDKAKYNKEDIEAILDGIAAFLTGDYTVQQQQVVTDFAAEVQAQIDSLEPVVYTEYLDVATSEYEAVEDTSIYTDDSWAGYQSAYEAAKALTDADQTAVNEALTNLANAKGELKLSYSFVEQEGSTTVLDRELMYIYGLDIGLTDIEDYVDYSEGVTYEAPDGIGTGATVTTMVNGEAVEVFTVIIFGDLNGDSVIDIYDAATLAAIVNGDIEVDETSAMYFAADLNGDTVADIYDLAILNAVVNGEIEIGQVPLV